MNAENKEVKITGAEYARDNFLTLNTVSPEAAREIVAKLSPDNGEPDKGRRSKGHYIIETLSHLDNIHLAAQAFAASDNPSRVVFTAPYIVHELDRNPGHFTAPIDGLSPEYVAKARKLDEIRKTLVKKMLEDRIITPKEASHIGGYPDKFTKVDFGNLSEWLTLTNGSPELVERLKESFSPDNGDPKADGSWKKTAGWMLPSTEGTHQPVVIHMQHGLPGSEDDTVSFMRPVYVEKVPGQAGHYRPQFRQDGRYKTQGMTSDLRASLEQLMEKLTAEGFIDKAVGEKIIKEHEAYLDKDIAYRRQDAASGIHSHAQTVARERQREQERIRDLEQRSGGRAGKSRYGYW